MHKKLEAELVSLAHRILQMKNRDEVIALRDKAHEVYEKLAVLAFIDDYVATTPNLKETKEELVQKIEKVVEAKDVKISKQTVEQVHVTPQENVTIKKEEPAAIKKPSDKEGDIFEPKFDSVKIDIGSLKSNQISSKEEFRDAISADKTSTLFEDEDTSKKEKKTLNDKLVDSKIKVGLNDRIAFVNHLFDFKQADFNEILAELNRFKTEKEAKDYITNKVKPKYDWHGKEAYEDRLMTLIERKF